ncbi:hypothetical protein HYZ97_00490 [Candidatus Pacearchaeota archaeon]|nr:hypothetical protein [Candidatus Pacearchaeota archaeon]
MEEQAQEDTLSYKDKITTIKLSTATKQRLEHLKLYKRETYEEIMQRLLNILNITIKNPEAARHKLISLERQRKRNLKEMK